jgi:hypothetical protein
MATRRTGPVVVCEQSEDCAYDAQGVCGTVVGLGTKWPRGAQGL